MMTHKFPLLAAIGAACLTGAGLAHSQTVPAGSATTFVRPEIGTGGHGHTYPGATMPHGMVQLSPDTDYRGWDWCSGYHRSDDSMLGFSHTHLSGTGCADLCDILFAPTVGEVQWEPGAHDRPDDGYRSRFDHADEVMSPGYYKVRLKDGGIDAELTATERVGIHRYTFPAAEAAHFIVDLVSGNNSPVREGQMTVESDKCVTGSRCSDGWVSNKTYYFAAEFSQPMSGCGFLVDDKPVDGVKEAKGKKVKAHLDFKTEAKTPVLVKVGISAVSVEGAKKNLRAEAPDWNFDGYCQRAAQAWDAALGRIRVEGADDAAKQTFYTSLYHALCAPVLFCDADGSYRGNDGQVHAGEGFKFYSTFSTWDTFRAEHPLITILEPERVDDMALSLLAHYDHSRDHMLPVWTESGRENWCMIACGSIPILGDALLKGLTKADPSRVLTAMHTTLQSERFGWGDYSKLGYIPAWEKRGDEDGTVSKTVELAYDDSVAAQVARKVGNAEWEAWHDKRANNWRNVFNDAIGSIQPRKRDGTWTTGFDPRRTDTRNYTEGSGYHYGFFVPHNVAGLAEKMGGREKFIATLDKMFSDESKVEGDDLPDVSGLIGQYAHGNEPSHHAAYLYDYVGEPWKTQYWVREIMTRLYNNTPEGLCGNEDCGQMSAWYALSAMGFYSANPASGQYALGSPVFSKVTIEQPGGKVFTVIARNNSPANKYIRRATLNGKALERPWITHGDIQAGATLELEMGAEANKTWGIAPGATP